MAKNLSYKKSTQVTLKACGKLNLENGTINIDGSDIQLTSLFSDFDNTNIEMCMKIKDEEELDVFEETNVDTEKSW